MTLSAAERIHLLEPEPAEAPDMGAGPCPGCKGDSLNGEVESDGGPSYWVWTECDKCLADLLRDRMPNPFEVAQ